MSRTLISDSSGHDLGHDLGLCSGPYIGLNVYLWQRTEQNLFLSSCLRPLVGRLEDQALSSFVWVERFDARGPHLFVVLRCDAGDVAKFTATVNEAVAAFFADRQASGALSDQDLAERHEECRGKSLWQVDRQPGFAKEHSYVLEPIEGVVLPLYYWRDFATSGHPRLAELVAGATAWALERVPIDRDADIRAGITWCAAFNACLLRRTSPGAVARYWQHHASSLVIGLEERWLEEPEEVRNSLPDAVKPNTAGAFAKIFSSVEAAPLEPWPQMDQWITAVLDAAPNENRGWRLLREINHSTLKQLGLYVRLHIPLTLFAWHRALEQAEAQA